jgi:hypothetical protein
MRNHTTVSDLNPADTSIRSGAHSQIWVGREVDITFLFDSDADMFTWVQDLYSKTVAAMPDDVFAVQITEPTKSEPIPKIRDSNYPDLAK